MRLNLGAGNNNMPGYINVDRAKLPTTDTLWDLDATGPWPWDTGSIERIEAAHIFEHLWFPIHFMTEAHRVLADDGILHILTPHLSSLDSFTDPTHVRHCTEYTFCYWINDGNPYYVASNEAYGGVSFTLREHKMIGAVIDITLAKITDRDPAPSCDDRAGYGEIQVFCALPAGHEGQHESADFAWPIGSITASFKASGIK